MLLASNRANDILTHQIELSRALITRFASQEFYVLARLFKFSALRASFFPQRGAARESLLQTIPAASFKFSRKLRSIFKILKFHPLKFTRAKF